MSAHIIEGEVADSNATDVRRETILLGGTGVILREGLAPVSSPPDIAAEFRDVPGLALRAVSLRGPGHRAWTEPRQDAYAIADTDGWLVAVVADGIGSKPWSHVGSSVAAQAVVAGVMRGLDPQDLVALLEVADRACNDAAGLLDVIPSDLSSTLTVVAIPKKVDADGARSLTIHEVGDSPALLLEARKKAWTILTADEKLGHAPVDAVVPDFHEYAVTYGRKMHPGDVMVIASDGLLDHLGDGTGAYATSLAALWAAGPRRLIQFIADLSTNFDAACHEDDRTVVAVWSDVPG